MSLEKYLRDNNLRKIESYMSKNPDALLENPKIIEFARTADAVRKLLQIKKFDKESTAKVSSVTRGIKACFKRLVSKWPEIAVECLDLYMEYSGKPIKLNSDHTRYSDNHKIPHIIQTSI